MKSTGQRLTELRRSGASGRHGDRRTKRVRTRGAAKQKAIKEQA
jgi:hypothetical protein